MKLDTYEIEIGDMVFDLIFGSGKVERLVPEQDKFWVRFSPGNLRCFDNKGFGNFKERTLFWKNPITVIPHKHDSAWDTTQQVHEAVAKILVSKR
jgi:hypothetical protein